MQNIKNIILDYGNVIFMIDFARAQQAFVALGVKNASQIFGHKQQSGIFDRFDKGSITPAAFRDAIRELAQAPDLTDQQIDDAWNALLIGVPPGMHELLLSLKNRYRLFLLSNNNAIHYQYIMDYLKREFDLDGNASFFIKDYYSHLIGMRKPDAEIFEFVLTQNDLIPEETLFIDDSPQHLATAAQLGIHTALCTPQHTLAYWIREWKL